LTQGKEAREAATALGVLAVSLALHVRTQPYMHLYQNRLETVLASSAMLAFVAFGWAVHQTDPSNGATMTQTNSEADMLVVLLAPASVYLAVR
jgi:hypothetical protein